MLRNYFYLLGLLALSLTVNAQPQATTAQQLMSGLEQKAQMTESSLVKNLPFKNIGPTVMSGRVVDLAVNPDNPTEFYVGYASGGVWHTKNNGTSFEPILDNSPTQNVGSLAVDWKTGTIWVGTGEINASRSSYAGIGLLKSTDNGKTWENMGLTDSHHIAKILINPQDPNEVVVGVTGHLYSKNDERGVYKSTDGGKTWNRTLFVDNESGIIEMDVDRNNFDLMYASSWQKDRKAWNFTGNGKGSGIYKSTDGGDSWTLVSTEGSGFPTGDGVGRIGLAVVDANTVYAIHDSQFRREGNGKSGGVGNGLSKDDFKSMSNSALLALDDKRLDTYLRTNGFQQEYTSKSVKQMVRGGSVKPADLAKYLEDANTLLFDTPVIGAEVYKSTDGGKSWSKTHDGYLDSVYFSYGYYFGKVHVDPSDANAIYIYGVPILASKDGGKTFNYIGGDNVHADHHALWINPDMPGHLINGNDGGVNISYDDGAHWIKANSPSVGQFYSINVDHEEPYNVYGGLQDNGVWVGSHTYQAGDGWHQSGKYPYESIMGGDGMQVQIDNRNSDIVYTGFQFGNYFRLNRETGEQTRIQPKHKLGESPYRFNWQTPILLSPHNQDILYLGGNKLMRSMNQGDDWQAISPDLTKGGKPGNVSYGTLTTISESPSAFGTIYVGTDDGQVQLTRDGGGSWNLISSSFKPDLWVSRVIASSHSASRVYVTLNGYRWDDFAPYVYMSDNYGATWKDISANLPASPVNVIREDPHNENVLYLGTDNGAYVSLDMGASWQPFHNGLPNVAYHDMVVQPKANHLVLGTHGRSMYIADMSLIQQMNAGQMNQVVVGDIASARASRRWGTSWASFLDAFEPSVDVQYYVPAAGKATVTISTESGTEVNRLEVDADKGFNQMAYDYTLSDTGVKNMKEQKLRPAQNGKTYLPKGKYTMTVAVGGKTGSKTFELK